MTNLLQEGDLVVSLGMSEEMRVPHVVGVVDKGDGVNLLWNKGDGYTVGIHRPSERQHTLYYSSSHRMLFPLEELKPL